MPQKELKDYYEWFLLIVPQRVNSLTEVVRGTKGWEAWTPDYSPKSLEGLGNWFVTQVETRQRTSTERKNLQDHSAFPIIIPKEELTEQTFSIAMDIGIYLSQVLRQSFPTLRWEQHFESKQFVDYGQPILVGFHTTPFNPVRIVVNLAYGIASKEKSGNALRTLFDTWSKMI